MNIKFIYIKINDVSLNKIYLYNNQKKMSQKKNKLNLKLLSLEDVDFTNPNQKIKSPRSLNIISSLGLKPKDLYKISFKEFLTNNPELKKMGKEIQEQRYKLYEDERQNNINRCIEQRKEIIMLTKKSKNHKNNNDDKDKLASLSDNDFSISEVYATSKSRNLSKTKSNTNSQVIKINNYKVVNEKDKKIYMTENSYIMQDKNGNNAELTKEDLNKITCLKNEKNMLDKKNEMKEDAMLKYLKSEIMREKKIQLMKKRINLKEKKLSNFLKERNEGIKIIENERYHDKMDIYKRQKLYEKMLYNYDKKIYTTKKQQQEQIRSKTLDTEKLLELNEQIRDFERKNNEYKRKIENIFDLKEKQEMEDKKLVEKKFDIHKPDLGLRKIADLEKKIELERLRRENALINNINKFQNKINNILVKKEEKEKKILKTKESEEKKREEKLMINNLKYEEVRNNVRKNQTKLEQKRNLMLKSLEKKDLKDFAIKQEKIKMFEERKKINQMNKENREILKNKLKNMINEKNFQNIENDENLLNKLLYN